MNIYRDDASAKVMYCSDSKSLIVQWGEADVLTHKEVFNEVLQLIQANPTYTYISDIREQGVLSDVSRRWMETELLPAAILAGLKKVAVIVDEEIFSQFFVKPQKAARKDSPQYLEFRYLYSMEEAKTWATEVLAKYEGQVFDVA